MGYRNLRQCVDDLQAAGMAVVVDREVDPKLEAAEIQRRVFQAGGPALFFPKVQGCRFPMASNLFGSMERVRYIFRDTLAAVEKAVALKADPTACLKRPWAYWGAAMAGLHMLPRKVRNGPIVGHRTTVDQLPQVVSWPEDGGAFVTLPQVYTEHPDKPGLFKSNLGMYRVQLGGNAYRTNEEVGLHYQIHRGIGVHHAAAAKKGQRLPVNVVVGGPPAMAVSAVMPLPEGFPELCFAGALAGRAVRMVVGHSKLPMPAEADFCITGSIDPTATKPEGPFGDHLGYYSLVHDFPVMQVEQVFHRTDAVWPFTTVGRPPQEDTLFGALIHEITGPVIPAVLPGVHGVHAVDAAGVHPLLLAVGSERYTPYLERKRPQELLTQANAILGQGQMSLAKYLFIAAHEDDPELDLHDPAAFFRHFLARVDWTHDLHFQTCTTIDTLDYSAGSFNEGSKLVAAAVGPAKRELGTSLFEGLWLPEHYHDPSVCLPGVLAVTGPAYSPGENGRDGSVGRLCQAWNEAGVGQSEDWKKFPLVVVVDDARFTAATLNNFLWVTFTRSNPAADAYGVESFTHDKHWGCRGPLVLDCRQKPWMPKPLLEDPAVTRRVDDLFASTGPLARWG